LNWWTHLLRDERLAHSSPDMLSFEELVTLQATLLGKMMVVNGALHRRYTELLDSTNLVSSNKEARDVLARASKHIDELNRIMRDELAFILSEKHHGADDPD
jgi:hypothetical protein